MNCNKLGGLANDNESQLRLTGDIGGAECWLHIANSEPLCMQHAANGWIHLAKSEKARDLDMPTWDQAMKDCPDLEGWLAGIAKRSDSQKKRTAGLIA